MCGSYFFFIKHLQTCFFWHIFAFLTNTCTSDEWCETSGKSVSQVAACTRTNKTRSCSWKHGSTALTRHKIPMCWRVNASYLSNPALCGVWQHKYVSPHIQHSHLLPVDIYRETEKKLTIPTQESGPFASCWSPTKENQCWSSRCIKIGKVYVVLSSILCWSDIKSSEKMTWFEPRCCLHMICMHKAWMCKNDNRNLKCLYFTILCSFSIPLTSTDKYTNILCGCSSWTSSDYIQ